MTAITLLLFLAIIATMCFLLHGSEEPSKDIINAEDVLLKEEMAKPLTPVKVPFPLEKGEKAYAVDGVFLYETRKVRTGTAFAGPTLSVPISKALGLRFRAGYFAHAPTTTDTLVKIDEGALTVTNRNLYFLGRKRSNTISFREILQTNVVQSPFPNLPFLISITKRKGKVMFFATIHPSKFLAPIARLSSTCDHLLESNTNDEVPSLPRC